MSTFLRLNSAIRIFFGSILLISLSLIISWGATIIEPSFCKCSELIFLGKVKL
jgi:hypothetical protein